MKTEEQKQRDKEKRAREKQALELFKVWKDSTKKDLKLLARDLTEARELAESIIDEPKTTYGDDWFSELYDRLKKEPDQGHHMRSEIRRIRRLAEMIAGLFEFSDVMETRVKEFEKWMNENRQPIEQGGAE